MDPNPPPRSPSSSETYNRLRLSSPASTSPWFPTAEFKFYKSTDHRLSSKVPASCYLQKAEGARVLNSVPPGCTPYPHTHSQSLPHAFPLCTLTKASSLLPATQTPPDTISRTLLSGRGFPSVPTHKSRPQVAPTLLLSLSNHHLVAGINVPSWTQFLTPSPKNLKNGAPFTLLLSAAESIPTSFGHSPHGHSICMGLPSAQNPGLGIHMCVLGSELESPSQGQIPGKGVGAEGKHRPDVWP